MSIKSTDFGGVRLSGEDARKFKAQITYGRPKAAAQEGLAAGRILVKQLQEKGYAKFKIKEPV